MFSEIIELKGKSCVENTMIIDVLQKTFTVLLRNNDLKVILGSVTFTCTPSNVRIGLVSLSCWIIQEATT